MRSGFWCLIFLAGLFYPSDAVCQPNPEYKYRDKIVLSNKHTLVGQVIHYGPDTLKFELLSGQEIVLLQSQLKKVVQYEVLFDQQNRYNKVSLLDKLENKHLFWARTGLASGKSNANYFIIGSELHVGYKYQLAKNHLLTSTIGVDLYGRSDQVVYFPVLLGYEYYFDRLSGMKPYAGLSMGYSLAKATERSVFDNLSGGFHWSPVIGVLFHTRNKLAYFIETGYKFQRSMYNFTNWGTGNDVDIYYKRFLLRFGVLF